MPRPGTSGGVPGRRATGRAGGPDGDERRALGRAGPNPSETGAADPHDPLLAAAVALGWPLRGPFVVHAVRPFGPAAPDSGPPGPETGPLLAARGPGGTGPDP
ncbi:hypothetical protein [Streptomyces sp. KL110A]|uniref:hypothetical protein n=1 Tax=Streptomyces sp. KL110A TaxID=3384221 RepID=UPI0038CA6E48